MPLFQGLSISGPFQYFKSPLLCSLGELRLHPTFADISNDDRPAKTESMTSGLPPAFSHTFDNSCLTSDDASAVGGVVSQCRVTSHSLVAERHHHSCPVRQKLIKAYRTLRTRASSSKLPASSPLHLTNLQALGHSRFAHLR